MHWLPPSKALTEAKIQLATEVYALDAESNLWPSGVRANNSNYWAHQPGAKFNRKPEPSSLSKTHFPIKTSNQNLWVSLNNSTLQPTTIWILFLPNLTFSILSNEAYDPCKVLLAIQETSPGNKSVFKYSHLSYVQLSWPLHIHFGEGGVSSIMSCKDFKICPLTIQ